MHNVIICIGSNLGDRRLNLSRAMRRVGMEFGAFEMSHAVESPAWGYESEHDYLNIAMIFATDMEPLEVLDRLQAIEREISPEPHRNPDGSYADRVIDIDILAIDDLATDTPRLTLPHPRLSERRFFLEPMTEIAPGWMHPVSGLTAARMLELLDVTEKCE